MIQGKPVSDIDVVRVVLGVGEVLSGFKLSLSAFLVLSILL